MNKNSKKLSYVEGVSSIFVNVILFILKYWVGLLTGSVAIIADAWHTLSDSLTSIVVLIGAKISSKPADDNHPFGHGRAEAIGSIIIGTLLFMVGVNFFVEAIDRLRHKEAAIFTMSSIIVFVISVIVKEALAQFSFWAYKKTNSQSLKADGWHHRSDAIASFIILISIFMGQDLWWIDGVFGLLVSGIIIYTAFDVIKEASDPILGLKLPTSIVERIEEIGKKYNLIGIHQVKGHQYGSHAEYTMHVYLPKNMVLNTAHNTIEGFRAELKKTMNINATIFLEPGAI